MVALSALWLPIVLSAVLVFVASSVIHMALGYHAGDFRKLPSESDVLDALRPFALAPGDYFAPRPGSMADMNTPEFKAKLEKGPRIVLTVMAPGNTGMGRPLALWFVYTLVVGLFAGYVAGVALPAGAPYLRVFRIAGTVAFAAHALGQWPQSIWYAKSVKTTLVGTFDSLVFALLTAGVFGWLWPAA